jgi:DNA-binding response OmpR family regulator
MQKAKILLVEDDENLGNVIRDYLQMCGYEVDLQIDGDMGWEAFKSSAHDLYILDVMMPKLDGFSLATKIRKENQHTPILFLTAKSGKEDKIHGFKIGADDYILKPFNIEELVLRIEVFLKRSKPSAAKKSLFEIGHFIFDYDNLQLNQGETSQALTQKEADVLKLLSLHVGNVVKREDILIPIWGNDDYFAGRSLDVFISKLRKYLRSDSRIEIMNVHSVGFKLQVRG